MKKGDIVRLKENIPYLKVNWRHHATVVSQSKYRLPNGGGSCNYWRGWDVELKFKHLKGTIIVQGDELVDVREGRRGRKL